MRSLPILPENFEMICQFTGQTVEELRVKYEEDLRQNRATFLLVSEYKVKLRKDACFYNYHRSVGEPKGRWICALHNQESKYEITEGSRLPCLGVDPYP